MGNRTALFNQHLEAGGKIVDFGGWDMPIHYGSQIEEHHAVRQDAGIFDVSHMTVVDITGDDARRFLQKLLANDVVKLEAPGKALYTAMLKEDGGIIDDLIVYNMDGWYRAVVNCATREKDLAWIDRHAEQYNVQWNERSELAMVAVQGPNAIEQLKKVIDPAHAEAVQTLKPFNGIRCGEWFIARTGYTGEDGVEIILPEGDAPGLWQKLLDKGVRACGLGARDTLRLEAGMNLYGSDMDETVTPLESRMAWSVAWEPKDRGFIGRDAMERQKAQGVAQKLVGLVLETRGVLRGHQTVILPDGGQGEITSGTFSPTLKHAIALARVPVSVQDTAQVEIRGKLHDVRVVKPPFVRNGKKVFE